jgi:hypothetical protein
VICQRYQKGQSIGLTSNEPLGEWRGVFGDDPTPPRTYVAESVMWRSLVLDWHLAAHPLFGAT